MQPPVTPSNPLIPDTMVPAGIQGRKHSNLAFALRKLPPDRREDALEFYDFCRLVDDIADAPGIAPEARRMALDAWRRGLESDDPPIPASLSRVIDRHQIDPELLIAIVDGVSQDIEAPGFPDFPQLYDYCWKVASAVGLASIRIFGIPAPHGTDYAENLGIALQLTNIIRDVGEDAGHGRIYLPSDELVRFGVQAEEVLARRHSTAFQALMDFQIDRARSYYRLAEASAPTTWPDAMRPSRLMAVIYSRLLDKIAHGRQSVLIHRYRLHPIEKLWHLVRA